MDAVADLRLAGQPGPRRRRPDPRRHTHGDGGHLRGRSGDTRRLAAPRWDGGRAADPGAGLHCVPGTAPRPIFYAAAQNRQLRTTLRLFAITTTLAWIPLILGAVLGGTAQTLLWAAAFAIDWNGGLIASFASGWQLRSPNHFAERHGLVVIIALGESLAAVGAGAGPAVTRAPVLVAGVLVFTTAACVWWLYFENAASAAGQALAREPRGRRRSRIATNTYSAAHFPLIAGVIYIALGVEQVVAHLAHNQPLHFGGAPLDWTSTVALYGGVILYLTGRALFLRLSVGSVPPAQFVAVGVALLLLPVGRILPALTSFGLITAFLFALVCYERLSQGTRTPPTSA